MQKGGEVMANRLKEIRKARGITQAELAEKTGISRNTIINIERENLKYTQTETMKLLADALEVKIADIFLF